MAFTDEKNRKFQNVIRGGILPALAVVEAIASRGRSPGTGVLRVAKSLDDRDRAKKEEAKRLQSEALQKKLREFQLGEISSKKASSEQKAASLSILKRNLELAGDDEDAKTEALLKYQLATDPTGALQSITAKGVRDSRRISEDEKRAAEEKRFNIQQTKDKQRFDIEQRKYDESLAKQDKKESRDIMRDRRAFKGDFVSDFRVKSFSEIDTNHDRMVAVWESRPDKEFSVDPTKMRKRGAIDQALITLFNKLLDEGSVVRETEYARTPSNAPFYNRITGKVAQLKEGGSGITDIERQELFDTAERMFSASESKYTEILNTYAKDARDSDYDMSKIFTGRDLGLLGLVKNLKKEKRKITQEENLQSIFQGSQNKTDEELIDELMMGIQ